MPKSYDDRGSLITGTPTATAVGAATQGACFGENCGVNGKVVGTSSSKAEAEAAMQSGVWKSAAVFGAAAALMERLLL